MNPIHLRSLAGVLVIVSALFALNDGLQRSGIDFYHYWIIPRVMGNGTNIYDSDVRSRIGEQLLWEARQAPGSRLARVAGHWQGVALPSGTPFFYTALSPLMHGPYDTALWRFQILSLAVALAGTFVLARLFGHQPWLALLLTALLCSPMFEPFRSDQVVANVNRLMLGCVALLLWLRSRPSEPAILVAGAVLGLLLAFKPSVGAAVVLLGIHSFTRSSRRELWQEGLGFALGCTFAFVISSLAFGSPTSWLAWPTLLETVRKLATVPLGNFGLVALVSGLTGITPSPTLFGAFFLFVLAIAATPTVMLRRRALPISRDELARERGLVASTGVVAFLVASPLVWLHYELLAIPAILWLLGPAASPSMARRRLALLALLLLCRIGLGPWLKAGATSLATLILFGLLLANLAALVKRAPSGRSAART